MGFLSLVRPKCKGLYLARIIDPLLTWSEIAGAT